MAQQTKPGRSFQTESIICTPRGVNPPLSFAQLPIWHSVQLSPNRSFYNISFSMYFRGSVEVEPLKQSLNTIIQRHETLRTAFTGSPYQPMQV